jgi:hypothetical protein
MQSWCPFILVVIPCAWHVLVKPFPTLVVCCTPSFVGKKCKVLCRQHTVYCMQSSVLLSTICLQLLVLWVLRNVSTDSPRASHAVLPVPSGKVNDKVVPVKSVELLRLTFKNRASYIQDGRTATLQMLHFIYIFLTSISTEHFKHAAHSPFFSSKCRLFHIANFLVSVLSTFYIQNVLKFKCKTLVPKV